MVFKRIARALTNNRVVALTPGQIFPWRPGQTITAIDPVVIELPKALFRENEVMGDILETDDDAGVAIPPDSENIFVSLQPGMAATIRRGSQSCLFANDIIPRRVRITEP